MQAGQASAWRSYRSCAEDTAQVDFMGRIFLLCTISSPGPGILVRYR